MTGDDPEHRPTRQLSDEEFHEEYGVPRQESYTCLSCGKTAYRPVDEVAHTDPDAAQIQYIGDDDDAIIICWECLQTDDWEERARQRRAEQRSETLSTTVRSELATIRTRLSTALDGLVDGDADDAEGTSSTVDDADRHRTREERLEWKLEQEREWSTYLEQELQAKDDELTEVRETLHELRQAEETPPPEATPRGRAALLTTLFDVRDTLATAIADARDGGAPGVAEGLQQIDRQIETTLREAGIERIDTDGASRPRYHRTVATVPTDAHPPGTIVEVYQAGYRRGDEILRPAHVAVAEPPDDDVTREESVGSGDEPVGQGGAGGGGAA
jgi:molecular chaperone GrpE